MCKCKKNIEVKIKKLSEDAVIPTYAKAGDAGMDMTAISMVSTEDYIEYGTGIAVKIPDGHVGLLFPRSSNSKYDLSLCNSVGVIDSGYVGEIKFRYAKVFNIDRFKKIYKQSPDVEDSSWTYTKEYVIGDRIGQLVVIPYPQVSFVEVDELEDTIRGEGGFGSTN